MLYSDRKSNVVCLFLVFKVSVINCNILFVRHHKFFVCFFFFVVAEGSQAPLSIQSNHWIWENLNNVLSVYIVCGTDLVISQF